MTDKVEKILSKIQTRKLCTMDEHMAFYNDKAKEDYEFLSEIEELVKALQEDSQERIIKNLKKLGWNMYNAYQYLTTDASHVRKAMEEWYDFINYNLNKHEEQNPSNAEITEKDCNITGIKSKHAEGKLKECIESIKESLIKARKQLEEGMEANELPEKYKTCDWLWNYGSIGLTEEHIKRLYNAINILESINEHTDAKYLKEIKDKLLELRK